MRCRRILLTQRLRPPEALHWGLPGNTVDHPRYEVQISIQAMSASLHMSLPQNSDAAAKA